MKNDVLASILEGTFTDPDSGKTVSVPTETVAVEDSLDGMEQDLVLGLSLGPHLAVVSDSATHEALGRRVEKALAAKMKVSSIVLPFGVHADMTVVKDLRAAVAGVDALIAVGSGTVTDLCKYRAAQDQKPFAVFGTAPSMNGYTSVNASITVDGFKSSLSAAAARGVFLDLDVLANSPKRLIRSGLGDSLSRSTAQADWLLAHLLLGRPYRETPFLLQADDEPGLLAEPEALLAGDLAAMRRLARLLILSGFGMTVCGSSHPASQGEHLISHYVEMLGAPEWPEAHHGEQIGVTTLTMAGLQERLLEGGPPAVNPTTITEADVIGHFGDDLGPSCWKEFSLKALGAPGAEAVNDRLRTDWETIRQRIDSIRVPERTLRDVLVRAGAPDRAEKLGWPKPFYQSAVRHAREIRNRYTFLDLAGDCGLLDRVEDF